MPPVVEVRHYTATIPAGTPASAPVLVALAMPPREVVAIHWRVPHGPMGSLGWLLAMGGVAVLPQPPGTFVIADNEHGEWTPTDLPDSGAWQVRGYNTGASPHAVYLAFHVQTIGRPPAAARPRLIPDRVLASGPLLGIDSATGRVRVIPPGRQAAAARLVAGGE